MPLTWTHWTQVEEDVVRLRLPVDDLVALLPQRSRRAINARSRHLGIDRQWARRADPKRLRAIQEMRASGRTLADIAGEFGVTLQAISALLIRYGPFMREKQFIALADAIRRHNLAVIETFGVNGAVRMLFSGGQLGTLADFCESQNPLFERVRWLAYIGGNGMWTLTAQQAEAKAKWQNLASREADLYLARRALELASDYERWKDLGRQLLDAERQTVAAHEAYVASLREDKVSGSTL